MYFEIKNKRSEPRKVAFFTFFQTLSDKVEGIFREIKAKC